MPSSFTITATTNSVMLNDNRRAVASFTVYNASGQPRRGRGQIVALQPEALEWFSIQGEIERDFNIGGTSQYTVGVVVPPTAPAGSYSFRLNMVGVDNPDEDFTEGQAVTFQVPEPAEKRQIPWKIPAIVAAVLVLLIIAVVSFVATRGSGQVQVPDVAGSTVSDATAILEEARITVASETIEETSESIAAGLVTRTDPSVGSEIESESEVSLFVSTGDGGPKEVIVPEVAGLSAIEATTSLTLAGFKVASTTRDEPSNEVNAGMVIGTEPPGDAALDPGSEITLILSLGPLVVIPDTPIPTATISIPTATLAPVPTVTPVPTIAPVPTSTSLPPEDTRTPMPSQDVFLGNWVNADQLTRGMTRLVIRPVDQTTVSFQGYGSCSPTDCDWGIINVPFNPPVLVGTYDFGFKTTRMTVRLAGQELRVENFDHYTDGRTDRTSNEVLRKSSTSPIGGSFQRAN